MEDTEETLRNFLTKEMKIRQDDVDHIQLERVHRIPTRPFAVKKQYPRPITAEVSFYQDKKSIKSHIKDIRKGSKYGVADDFPIEVDEIKNPVLRKARSEQKTAFFNVEKLLINGALYLGPETKQFPIYGRLMDRGCSTISWSGSDGRALLGTFAFSSQTGKCAN